jgi:hypothetical protein
MHIRRQYSPQVSLLCQIDYADCRQFVLQIELACIEINNQRVLAINAFLVSVDFNEASTTHRLNRQLQQID